MNKCEKLQPATQQAPETELAFAGTDKCEDVQLLLLIHPEAPEVADHLAKCPDCAEFAKLEKALRDLGDNAPASPSLASVMMKHRKPAWLRIGVPLGAAAAFVGVVALLGLEMPQGNAVPKLVTAVTAGPAGETTELAAWSVTLPTATSDKSSQNSETSDNLPSMAWDNADIETIASEVEQLDTACNWNIPVFNPVDTERKEVVQ
ncbi:MAG: hypothetical protein AB7F40_00440 [Victivallaceae bacterium]|nr:hypothetical protein [Victivallaceae bacterium]